jgi:hypothetical protein
MRFENKNVFFYFEKLSSLMQRWLGVVDVNLEVVGLAPGVNFMNRNFGRKSFYVEDKFLLRISGKISSPNPGQICIRHF